MIDLSLTSECAIESIGDVVAIRRDSHRIMDDFSLGLKERFIDFSVREKWDLNWTFHPDSDYVVALRQLRDAQETRGFAFEETEREHTKLFFAMKTAFMGMYSSLHAMDTFDLPRYFHERIPYHDQPLTSLVEAHHNHIEHGTTYCSAGEVTVRFLGGSEGAVFFVEGGKPYDLKPMIVGEIEAVYARNVGVDFEGRAETLDDLVPLCRGGYLKTGENGFVPLGRGYGKPVLTLSEKSVVSVENIDGVARTIILYPKDKCLGVEG